MVKFRGHHQVLAKQYPQQSANFKAGCSKKPTSVGFFIDALYVALTIPKMAPTSHLKIRFVFLITSLIPMLIWVVNDYIITKPIPILTWSIICGVLAASLPRRLLRPALLVIFLSIPFTLAWIGSVALTGFGPSNAAFEAARSGPLEELQSAIVLALTNGSFIFISLLTVAFTFLSGYLILYHPPKESKIWDFVFLIALLPFVIINLDGFGYGLPTKLASPEVRISNPWLHQIELGKSVITSAIDDAGRINRNNPEVRDAKKAEKLFDMQNGVAIFAVGDSSRADTFIQTKRGSWSAKLQRRLDDGLGVRLNNACSGGSSTADAIPRLFTGADIEDIHGIHQYSTILAKAKAAGAKTAYISNHEMWLLPESGHDLVQRTTSMGKPAFDEVPVGVLADFLKRNPNVPRASIIHLYGQHFNYEQRYPSHEFESAPNQLSEADLLEWHYAQAVEYGNKVLFELAKLIDEINEPSFIFFTSDHAENLPSDRTGKKFHALQSSGKFDTTVPALVLWNKAFKDIGKQKLLSELQKGTGLLAHQDLARAWLILAGMPGVIKKTNNPQTWGAKNPGERYRSISCADLHP